MSNEILHLLGIERWTLGEAALNTFRLVLEREGAGQMVEGILPHPMNQILGRIEVGGIARRVQEIHG